MWYVVYQDKDPTNYGLVSVMVSLSDMMSEDVYVNLCMYLI